MIEESSAPDRLVFRPALSGGRPVAVVLLSAHGRAVSHVPAGPVAGFEVRCITPGSPGALPAGSLDGAQAVVVELDPESDASWRRLEKIIGLGQGIPVAAAMASPNHADMRRCVRLGTSDVLPLPLSERELAGVLEHMGRSLGGAVHAPRKTGRVIGFLKSVGGVGATALLTQAACLLAQQEQPLGREVCLLDLDIQFGNAALYLGLAPKLSFEELRDAGDRADAALLRDVATHHSSGLQVIAAPPAILAPDALTEPQLHDLLDLVAGEFPTVLLDLPAVWTDWSLAAIARLNALCLVTELSVPSLRHARRQIEHLRLSGIGGVPLHVIANRVERGFWKPIGLEDAAQSLGHGICAAIGNDFRTLSAAINQGVPLSSIKRNSRIERDLAALLTQLLPPEA